MENMALGLDYGHFVGRSSYVEFLLANDTPYFTNRTMDFVHETRHLPIFSSKHHALLKSGQSHLVICYWSPDIQSFVA